jgi:hypothetical protein
VWQRWYYKVSRAVPGWARLFLFMTTPQLDEHADDTAISASRRL